MSHKREQLASVLHRAVQQVIGRGLGDPRVTGLMTVTGVEVSPDLREAYVKVSILPESAEELCMHGLRSAARHIRRDVGDLVDTARVPDLLFRLDRTLKQQAALHTAITRAAEELGAKQASPSPSAPASPETPS